MRKVLALAILFTVGMASSVWADGMTTVVGPSTRSGTTRTVFNNSGGALTSGTIVVWQQNNASFDRSGFPYVTTSTASDSIYTAGVTLDPSCADQALCQIVTEGPAITRISGAANGVAETEWVGTSSTAGEGDLYADGADTCALGLLSEDRQAFTGALCTDDATTVGEDNCPSFVLVRIQCRGN